MIVNVDPVLYRTPVIDPKTGNLTREWILFFQQIVTAVNGSLQATNNLSDVQNTTTARHNIGALP